MLIDPYAWIKVKITQIIPESDDAVSIITTKPKNYIFIPGQHAIIRITHPDKSTQIRQYSFSNSPNDTLLRFTIVKEASGEVSTWFNESASVADTLDISKPYSGPLQEPINDDKILMIAGGSGIAPMMSHILNQREQDTKTFITLLYSTRSRTECFMKELEKPQPNERIIIRKTNKQPRFTLEEIKNFVIDHHKVYICGSRPFVTSIKSIITDAYPKIIIFAESFTLQ